MPRFHVYGIATVAIALGVIEASTEQEARDVVEGDAVLEESISLCSGCGGLVGDDLTVTRVDLTLCPDQNAEPTYTGELPRG